MAFSITLDLHSVFIVSCLPIFFIFGDRINKYNTHDLGNLKAFLFPIFVAVRCFRKKIRSEYLLGLKTYYSVAFCATFLLKITPVKTTLGPGLRKI